MPNQENFIHSLSAEEEDSIFELRDRVWVQYASFEQFIQNHDGVHLVPGLREDLDEIEAILHSVFARLQYPFDSGQVNDEDTDQDILEE